MENRDEIAELMSEPPHGANHGRRRSEELFPQEGRMGSPNRDALQVDLGHAGLGEFLSEGGWHTERGTAHRGPLMTGEWVDYPALLRAVEARLGCSAETVRSVYRQGRLSNSQSELRASIDARMLALSRSGANLAGLGRVLGLAVNGSGHCRALENAVERARWVEETEGLMGEGT